MLRIIRTVALICALFPTAGSADAAMAARDKARMDLFADISCVYYINQGTVKFEYERGGQLMSHFRTFVRRGEWYVRDDKFCIATPGTGKLLCDNLRRNAVQTREEAVTYLRNLDREADAKCYD